MSQSSENGGDSSKLGRYWEIARVLARHVQIDWLRKASIHLPDEDIEPGEPEALADDLEALGPTFVKLGQMFSTRPDLLPDAYIEALGRLQSNVRPINGDEVTAIVEAEIGASVDHLFEAFDAEPLASASLGQVHRATLHGGRPVVIKVQRPHIRKSIDSDLIILEEIAGALDRHTELGHRIGLVESVEEFRSALLQELDYEVEARSLERLAEHLDGHALLIVPAPVLDYSTRRVLTMDYIEGEKITSLSPHRRTELDGPALADDLFSGYLDQILVHGFVHADPHPGNLLLTPDDRIALLDLGMVTELSREMREQLLKLLVAIGGERSRDAADILLEIGTAEGEVDRQRFRRGIAHLLQRVRASPAKNLEFGRLMIEMVRLTTESGVRPASELTMLAKTLLQLDQAAIALDPGFDPMSALERHAHGVLRQNVLRSLEPESLASAGIEIRELIAQVPKRMNRFLKDLSANKVRVQVDVLDEERLLTSLQSIANRLSVSIVLAALILGAALMMRIDTPTKIFGYPAIAATLFGMAAACGFYLVFTVFRGDRSAKKKR